jgi:hypothetical protein
VEILLGLAFVEGPFSFREGELAMGLGRILDGTFEEKSRGDGREVCVMKFEFPLALKTVPYTKTFPRHEQPNCNLNTHQPRWSICRQFVNNAAQ